MKYFVVINLSKILLSLYCGIFYSALVHAQVPLTFQAAMNMAVASSPSIKNKEEEFNAADQSVNGARWSRYPSLSLSLATKANYYNSSILGNGGVPQSVPGPTSTARLEQPLYTWGAINAKISGAQFQREVARMAVITETNSVLDRVIAAFSQAQQSQERIEVINESIIRLKEFEAMMERRYEAQIGSKNDITLVSSRILQAKSDLAQAVTLGARSRAALEELTGQSIVKVVPEKSFKTSYKSSDAVQVAALDVSSELSSANAQLEVANQLVSQKKGEILPAIVARLERIRYQQVGAPTVDYSQGYLALSATFGNGLSQFSEVKAKASMAEGAREQIEVVRRALIQSCASTWADVQAYNEQLSVMNEVSAHNKGIVESFMRQYIAGKKSWFEVLSAERDLTSSRLTLADIRASAFVANNRLQRLTGQLLKIPMPD